MQFSYEIETHYDARIMFWTPPRLFMEVKLCLITCLCYTLGESNKILMLLTLKNTQTHGCKMKLVLILLILQAFISYNVHMAMNTLGRMMPFVMSSNPLQRKLSFMWFKSSYMGFLSSMFHTSKCHVDIVLSNEEVQTFKNIVVTNFTCAYLLAHAFRCMILQHYGHPKWRNRAFNVTIWEIISFS
jgi:hypothetical protein